MNDWPIRSTASVGDCGRNLSLSASLKMLDINSFACGKCDGGRDGNPEGKCRASRPAVVVVGKERRILSPHVKELDVHDNHEIKRERRERMSALSLQTTIWLYLPRIPRQYVH